MKRLPVALLSIFILFFMLSGCQTQSISEIKDQEYVGEEIRVSGTVVESFKVGELSGFIIEDDSGEKIGVASESLPVEGEKIVVSGTLARDTIFGYYIVKG